MPSAIWLHLVGHSEPRPHLGHLTVVSARGNCREWGQMDGPGGFPPCDVFAAPMPQILFVFLDLKKASGRI